MIAIYPGSFDPATLGHLDIITRASKITSRLIVAILNNSAKKHPMFTVDERVRMLTEICGHLPNVQIESFSGLLVDFAEHLGANAVIRGLRAMTDFEAEMQMAQTNKTLNPNIETLFISTQAEYSFLSSSIVKEIAVLGGDISSMAPSPIIKKMHQKINGGTGGGEEKHGRTY